MNLTAQDNYKNMLENKFYLETNELIGDSKFQIFHDDNRTIIYEENEDIESYIKTDKTGKALKSTITIGDLVSAAIKLKLNKKEEITDCIVKFKKYRKSGKLEETIILELKDNYHNLSIKKDNFVKVLCNYLDYEYPLTYAIIDDVVSQVIQIINEEKQIIPDSDKLNIIARHLGDIEPEVVNYINKYTERVQLPRLKKILESYTNSYYANNDCEYQKIKTKF